MGGACFARGAIAVAAAWLLAMVGCGPAAPPFGERQEKQTARHETVIRVCPGPSAPPGWHEMFSAMQAEAAKHDWRVVLGRSPARQLDAVVLGCCDAKTARESIASAQRAGVPLFAAETPCAEAGGHVACSVRSDYHTGGRDAARAVVEMLEGQGDIAILHYPESPTAVIVTKAFREQIALAPWMRIVATASGGGDEETALAATRAVLRAHPGLSGLFAVDGPSAMGALRAVQQMGKADCVKIVAMSGALAARRAVKRGEFYATVFPQHTEVGRQAIGAVSRFLSRDPIQTRILVPCIVYRSMDAAVDLTLLEGDEKSVAAR